MVPDPGLNEPAGGPEPEPGAGWQPDPQPRPPASQPPAPAWPEQSWPEQGWTAPVPASGTPQQQQWNPAKPPYPSASPYYEVPQSSGPAPKPPALPTTPREYHEFFRAPRFRWWKPLAALAMFIAAWFVASLVLVVASFAYDVVTGRQNTDDLSAGKMVMTPMLFLANNVAIAVAMPFAMLTAWAVFAQRPKWLSSIAGGFRWRLFARFSVISFVLLAASLGVQIVLEGGVGGLAWNDDSLLLIIGILLTTPFQAAGEEYGLRGLGARAIGSWFGSRRAGLIVATIVTSIVFMLLHGAGDPWLNSFYLLFAVVSSVLVWRTGGLEASIALHVVNNLIGEAFVPFSDISGMFDRQAGVAGPETLWQMGTILLIAGLILWQAHRLGLPRAAAPAAPTAPELSKPGGVFWNSSHTIA